MTNEEVISRIKHLVDPVNGKTLEENEAIKEIKIIENENKVHLTIALGTDDLIKQAEFKKDLLRILKIDMGFTGVKLSFKTFKKQSSSLLDKSRNVKFIAVASGKGGVGKSTVTANLALHLQKLGKKVGLIDADIYGSSINQILNITTTPDYEDEMIIPINVNGVEIISTAMLMPDNKPLMWRGPMLNKLLNHFFNDVKWSDDLEYIVIDLPPGTGDVQIDIQSLIPECKEIIVTTPHKSAAHVAVRAGLMARELRHEILGIVENMSYYEVNGEQHFIFGKTGGNTVAEELNSEVLVRIPIISNEKSENVIQLDNQNSAIYVELAENIIKLA